MSTYNIEYIKETKYLENIIQLASKSTAIKKQVGAVIVLENMHNIEIIGKGFNHNTDSESLPCEELTSKGLKTLPTVIHAEIAAINDMKNRYANKYHNKDKILYINYEPCEDCEKELIKNNILNVKVIQTSKINKELITSLLQKYNLYKYFSLDIKNSMVENKFEKYDSEYYDSEKYDSKYYNSEKYDSKYYDSKYYDSEKFDSKHYDNPVTTKFKKYDSNKLDYTLIPPVVLKELVKVLTFGANKYGRDNWQKCDESNRFISAVYRHLEAVRCGEQIDKESGLHHFAHALANISFLVYFYPTSKFKQLTYKENE